MEHFLSPLVRERNEATSTPAGAPPFLNGRRVVSCRLMAQRTVHLSSHSAQHFCLCRGCPHCPLFFGLSQHLLNLKLEMKTMHTPSHHRYFASETAAHISLFIVAATCLLA
eukprot:GGOE01031028.1.p3 GENE.GGOE01031028.1~~GGOE01031028.1.p3  ORF type:complete len:111 (-),score=0.62 GGOE01031028.1:386-718(-)